MHAHQYHETVFSHLYPGNQPNNPAYIPTFRALDTFLAFTPAQKKRTVLRTDAGFGCDGNVNYALDEDWQVLTKGFSARRTTALVRKVTPDGWLDLGQERWVIPAVGAPTYICPVQYLLLRWRTESGNLKYGSVICSVLEWSLEQVMAHYDARGACETEIQRDKGGLKMVKRRKQSLPAQEALILLTDLAHNTVAWTTHQMFPTGPLATFGTTRLIEDVFTVPGRLRFDQDRLVEVQLNAYHPHAAPVAEGLERLWAYFGFP